MTDEASRTYKVSWKVFGTYERTKTTYRWLFFGKTVTKTTYWKWHVEVRVPKGNLAWSLRGKADSIEEAVVEAKEAAETWINDHARDNFPVTSGTMDVVVGER